MVVGRGDGENFVASDVTALIPVTRRFQILEEGDVAAAAGREGVVAAASEQGDVAAALGHERVVAGAAEQAEVAAAGGQERVAEGVGEVGRDEGLQLVLQVDIAHALRRLAEAVSEGHGGGQVRIGDEDARALWGRQFSRDRELACPVVSHGLVVCCLEGEEYTAVCGDGHAGQRGVDRVDGGVEVRQHNLHMALPFDAMG